MFRQEFREMRADVKDTVNGWRHSWRKNWSRIAAFLWLMILLSPVWITLRTQLLLVLIILSPLLFTWWVIHNYGLGRWRKR